MDKYLNYYKTKPLYLERALDGVISALCNGMCVAFCSAPKMGASRAIDYLNYYLEHNNDFHPIYDRFGVLDLNALENLLKEEEERIKVIILPKFLMQPGNIQYRFAQLVEQYKSDRVLTVVNLGYGFLDRPEIYFPDTIRIFNYVKIRGPMNFEQTQSYINSRRVIRNLNIPAKEERDIYKLSGGIHGLVKRLCEHIAMGGRLNIRELITNPAIKVDLNRLMQAYENSSTLTLIRLGLIKNKKVQSKLFEEFIKNPYNKPYKISYKLQQVLDLLLSKKGQIVSIDEIDSFVRNSNEFSFWGNYKLITRLKKELKKEEKYYIRNVKGKGYILENYK